MKYFAIVYFLAVIIMSLVAFAMCGIDKRRAKKNKRRVPERSLHLVALCGGWPGALAGQRVFRHKTQKLSFRIVFWLVVLLHFAVVGVVVYLMMQWG